MILAPIADAGRYARVHPLLMPALDWLQRHPQPVDGRHPVPGFENSLTAIVEHGLTRDPASGRFESHRAHIDVQVNLAGGEIMEWLPVARLRVQDDFQPDGDIAFYHQPKAPLMPTRLAVLPGWFAMFFPEDGHRPTCHLDAEANAFHKVVFKLAY